MGGVKLTERCGRCHKPLSRNLSIQRGLGPVCYKKIQEEYNDQESPLSDHFTTIVSRFIMGGFLNERDSSYFFKEADKAVEKKDRFLADILANEAVHWVISGKVNLIHKVLIINSIVNMFELAGNIKEADKQGRYLRKNWKKFQNTDLPINHNLNKNWSTK